MQKTLLQRLFSFLERNPMPGMMADMPLQEKSNLAEWLESRLHLSLTNIVDDMFGQGNVTREERKVLSGAIGAAMDAYHQFMVDNAPQLFERRPWDDAPEQQGMSVSEGGATTLQGDGNMELMESGDGMFVPLLENAVRRDGTIPVKIIQPGWGSSGYYPAEVLERDGPKIFTKGTKMFWNHQTIEEEAERPEGDLNNLAAEFVTDARYLANGPAGAGLYADAKVFEAYKKSVDDLAAHIGVSIRANGRAQHGLMEGREGPIITELASRKSVDFVTAPGAGGQILSLFEAARAVQNMTTTVSVDPISVHKEARVMDDKDLQALRESVATLQTNLGAVTDENARLKEGLAIRDAKDLASAVLAKFALPEVTRTRLLESLPKLATIKEGALDREATKTRIEQAVQAELKYLTEAAGLGNIYGLGEGGDLENDATNADGQDQLEAAFASIGLSESGAKIAANGRTK